MLVNQDFTGSEHCMGPLELSLEDSLDNNTTIAANVQKLYISEIIRATTLPLL